MKDTIILLIILVCVLFKVLWESITIESFDYQEECTDELADSIKTKRDEEAKIKAEQSSLANVNIPRSIDDLSNSFRDTR